MSKYLLTDKGKQKAAEQLKEQVITVYTTFKELAPQYLSSELLNCIDFDDFVLHLIDGSLWQNQPATKIDNLATLRLGDSQVPPDARIVLYFKLQLDSIKLFDDYFKSKTSESLLKLAAKINKCMRVESFRGTCQIFSSFLGKARIANIPSEDYRLFLVVYPVLQLDPGDKFEI